jgi:hypothetical protein
MDYDDEIRNPNGIAISLRDMGNGKSRLFLDNVKASSDTNPINWKFDAFYTFSPELQNSKIESMALTDEQYRDIGVAVMARLLALTGRS